MSPLHHRIRKDLQKEVQRYGITVDGFARSNGKHFKVIVSQGRRRLTHVIGKSPSDWRAMKNCASSIARRMQALRDGRP